ncbi:DUF6415 family natural product biosynthesis protein [Streptomyces sp. NPDC056132]|uniref:DUF6415 family natural product biosynthesis protein n=1 Tax=Streptomyces sp. NPDC056132 TaxID=3345722 RepID=UPI0035DA18BA
MGTAVSPVGCHHAAPAAPGTESLPIDVATIQTTIEDVLTLRSRPPATSTCARWHGLLTGHLNLLLPALLDHAQEHAGTDYARLAAFGAEFVRARMDGPVPADRSAAYGVCRDLARQCRTVLGLVTDAPETGR